MKKHYTDKELVQMIQSNDLRQITKAKDFLYHSHYSSIAKWLHPLPPKVRAIDIFAPKLTELVLDIQIGRTVVTAQAKIKTLLYAYCKNGKHNEQRTYNKQNNLKDKLSPPKEIETENALTAMIRKERKVFIAYLISKMQKNCQDSLNMYYFKGMRHKTIKEIMGLKTEQRSRYLLSNCGKKLRKIIQSYPNWEDLINL